MSVFNSTKIRVYKTFFSMLFTSYLREFNPSVVNSAIPRLSFSNLYGMYKNHYLQLPSVIKMIYLFGLALSFR